MIHKSKRYFLLLEVLIAIALVAITAIPLLAPSFFAVKNATIFSREIDAERLSGLILSALVIDLYNNKYTLQDFENQIPKPIQSEWLEGNSTPYTITYSFQKLKQKKEGEAPRFILLAVNIYFTPKSGKALSFQYQLFVESKKIENSSQETEEDEEEFIDDEE